MSHRGFYALAALTTWIGAANNAIAAGIAPLSLPEPSSLAVLAAGVGAVAIVKFWKSK